MLTSFLVIVSSVFLSVTPAEKSEPMAHAGYVKPGAATSLTHDYDGKTAIGEFETITVVVDHTYQEGVLIVEVLAPQALRISWPLAPKEYEISQGASIELPVNFSGTGAGRFSLSFEMVHKSAEGYESRRVTSIPIIVGINSNEKPQITTGKSTVSNLTGLVVLPAQEVIE